MEFLKKIISKTYQLVYEHTMYDHLLHTLLYIGMCCHMPPFGSMLRIDDKVRVCMGHMNHHFAPLKTKEVLDVR